MRHVRFLAALLCVVLATGFLIPAASTMAAQAPATPVVTSASPADVDALMVYTRFVTQFGPYEGPFDADGTLTSGEWKELPSGVDLSEFYAGATFITPQNTPAGSWSIGFSFWGTDEQPEFSDISIQARDGAARWVYGQSTTDAYRILQQGILPPGAIDFTPGAYNHLKLIVAHGLAIFIGSDGLIVTAIDLGGATGRGNVAVEVEFQADDATTTQGLPISIPGFVVADLSSEAMDQARSQAEQPTPTEAAQESVSPTALTQPTTVVGQPTVVPSQPTATVIQPTVVPSQATAIIVQPTAAPSQPSAVPVQPTQSLPQPTGTAATGDGNAVLSQVFDQLRTTAMANDPAGTLPPGTLQQTNAGVTYESVGISLANIYVTATFVNPTDLSKSSDAGIGFRDLNNDTDFRFVVTSDGVWAWSIGAGESIAQGTVPDFDSASGASTTLEVIAEGPIGLLAVNGEVVQQVDLSSNLNAGDVYIGSGFYESDTVDGRAVSFANVAVYQLPS